MNGVNIVSLNYADSHSTFQLDFAIRMNESRPKEPLECTHQPHHCSHAYKRRAEGLKGKNILALEMLDRTLSTGIAADYLLIDSWYAKPDFIQKAKEMGVDVVARLPNNPKIWHFKKRHRSLEAIYNHHHQSRHHHQKAWVYV